MAWLKQAENAHSPFERVNILTVFGTPSEKRNAIEVLHLGGKPPPSLGGSWTAKSNIESWLAEDSDGSVVAAALAYIGDIGGRNEIDILEEVFVTASPKRQGQIDSAVVRILSRLNPDEALARAKARQLQEIDARAVQRLFSNPSSLKTETLQNCLDVGNSMIRQRVVALVLDRNAISNESARTLITDTDFEIRLMAAESLAKQGTAPEDEVIKAALTKQKTGSIFGIGGLNSASDTRLYDQYVAQRLAELDFESLKAKVDAEGVFRVKLLAAYYTKFARKLRVEILQNLHDGFESMLEGIIADRVAREIYDTPLVNQFNPLKSFIRRQMVTNALSAICHLKERSDLKVVRAAIDNHQP